MLDNEPTGAAGANQNDDINPATGGASVTIRAL